MSAKRIYCVYYTFYSGNKLPPFYIGSTSVDKIKSGYIGSVSSKKYSKIWNDEYKNNPSLFRTKIICTFDDRKSALAKEHSLHKKLNVIKNPLYTNLANAMECGIFGVSLFKEQNPFYGKHHTDESKKKRLKKMKENGIDFSGEKNPFFGKTHTDSKKKYWSKIRTGQRLGADNPFYGKNHTEEVKEKIRRSRDNVKKLECLYCGKLHFPWHAWCHEKCILLGSKSSIGDHSAILTD